MAEELDGCFNKSADKVPRINLTWSDTNPNSRFDENKHKFDRLKCRNCEGVSFEVLQLPGSYRTMAKCNNCSMYYNVHCG